MNFNSLLYIELLQELEKFKSINNDLGDYRLDNSILIRNTNYNSTIFFEHKRDVRRDIFAILFNNKMSGETNIAETNFIYNPDNNKSISIFFDNQRGNEKTQYCDIETIDSIEFQMGTIIKNSNIFSFLCYLSSIQYKNGVYGSYNDDPNTMLYVLKLLKAKNESITA